MADTFSAFNSTSHGTVLLEDDYNNLLAHGLEKCASYILRKNGAYYEGLNGSTGKLVYGGSGNVGTIDGTSSGAVMQEAIDQGGLVFVKNSWDDLDVTLNPESNCHLMFEIGGTVTWSGGTDQIFENATKPLLNFWISGLNLDVNSETDAEPFVLDDIQYCKFKDVTVLNSDDKVVWNIKATTAATNTHNCEWHNIWMRDVYSCFTFTGTAASNEITLLKLTNIWAYPVTGNGIEFKGWASGIHFDTCWISLYTAGTYGVIWNNSGTPAANVGDYDNNFVNLKVDAILGTSNNAATVLLQFNNTKLDKVSPFFKSPPDTGVGAFVGTTIGTHANTVSYLVEDFTSGPDVLAAYQDQYPYVYSKAWMHGDSLHRTIATIAMGQTTYLELNAYNEAFDSNIILNTDDGSAREATIGLAAADGVFRLNTPTGKNLHIKMGDAAAANNISFRDSADAEVASLNSNGGLTLSENVDTSTNYKVAGTQVVGAQGVAVADAAVQDVAGGDTVDETKVEADLLSCKNAINAIIARLEAHGLIAT